MSRTDERGFGLIEVLVVVAIIAVLAGIAIPHVQGLRARGIEARVVSTVRNIASGQEAYYASRQHYTTSVDDIDGFVADYVKVTIEPGNSGDLASSFRVRGTAEGAGHAYIWLSDPTVGAPHLTTE